MLKRVVLKERIFTENPKWIKQFIIERVLAKFYKKKIPSQAQGNINNIDKSCTSTFINFTMKVKV